MKLFGSRKNAEFARKKPERTGRMPRWARIVLIVFAVLAALVLGLLAFKHFYVRPPKKADPPRQTVRELPVETKPMEGADADADEPPEEPVETAFTTSCSPGRTATATAPTPSSSPTWT